MGPLYFGMAPVVGVFTRLKHSAGYLLHSAAQKPIPLYHFLGPMSCI